MKEGNEEDEKEKEECEVYLRLGMIWPWCRCDCSVHTRRNDEEWKKNENAEDQLVSGDHGFDRQSVNPVSKFFHGKGGQVSGKNV